MRDPDEPVRRLPDARAGMSTVRGAIALAVCPDLRPVAYETAVASGWNHAIALCLPDAPEHGIPSDVARQPQRQGTGMVDLNTATAAELDSVPALKGHGFEIVRYREERGRFTSLRQLDEVPGLSGKTDGIADQVTVTDS